MSMELSSSLQPAMDADKMIYLNTDIYGKPQLSNKNITELMLNGQGKGSEVNLLSFSLLFCYQIQYLLTYLVNPIKKNLNACGTL